MEQIHILLSVEGQVGQDQLGALGQVASVDGLKQLLNAEIFTGITAFRIQKVQNSPWQSPEALTKMREKVSSLPI